MSNKTVRQLAEVVKIPLERLLEQLKEAGLSASAPDDVINEDEKMQLLAHLRKRHGKDEGAGEGLLKRVTLKRRTVSELKQASVPGSTTKTISVEVRKQKTYIKRSEVVDSDEQRSLELAKQALKEQVAKQAETIPSIEEPVQIENVVSEQKKEELMAEPEVKAVVETVEVEAVTEPEIGETDLPVEMFPPEAEEEIEILPVKEEKKINHEKSAKTKESAEARKNSTKKIFGWRSPSKEMLIK